MKIKPWAMTDAEVEKLISKRPDLARLWKDAQATKQG